MLKKTLSAIARWSAVAMGSFGIAVAVAVAVMLVCSSFKVSASTHVHGPELVPYTTTYYIDEPNSVNFSELVSNPWRYRFQDLNNQTNFGVSSASYWFRLNIPAQAESFEALLEIGYPLLDELSIYSKKQGKWSETKTGDSLSFSRRKFKYPNFLEGLDIRAGEPKLIYLKVRTSGPLNVTTQIWDDAAFYNNDRDRMIFAGSYYGALISMVIFNFFIYLTVRDRSYLYYVGYILFITLFTYSLHGFLSMYLLPNNPGIVNKILYPLLYVAMIFGLKFASEVNTVAKLSPGLFKVINGTCVALLGVGLLGLVLGNRFLSTITPFIGVSMIGLSLYAITVGVKAKYKPSYFVGFAFLSLMLGVVLYALGTLGLIKQGDWTAKAFQLSVVLEALLLSFALAYRIRYTEKVLTEVREVAGQTRAVFSRKLIESRDAERKMLASDLHDGLGQNLLAIKNKLSRLIDGGNRRDKNLVDAHNIIKVTIDDVRRLSHQLHPHILDRLGLKEAASAVVRDAFDTDKVRVKCLIDDTEVPRRSAVALHLYRIVQEGVKNIMTHADPEYVTIEMFQLVDNIKLRIVNLSDRSDLAWIPATDLKQGFGLSSIRERVDLLGGECIFHRNRTDGFKIEVIVPFIK